MNEQRPIYLNEVSDVATESNFYKLKRPLGKSNNGLILVQLFEEKLFVVTILNF